jgi:hypothetical protein
MSQMGIFLRCVFVFATIVAFPQDAFAAVIILDGTAAPPSQARPPAGSTPGGSTQEEAPSPAPSAPTENATPNPEAAPAPGPTTVVAPSLPALPAAPGAVKIANSAEVSVEMMPGETVSVGSKVSFRVTSKKAGYLVLVDVDVTGRLTQIYPNTVSLLRGARPNGNYVKPGATLTIPNPSDPRAAIQYVVSPPAGQAMIVAILSPQPVQILDLPDVPLDVKEPSDMLAYLYKWTNELRIPDDASHLREARWSFNSKSYRIQ